MNEEFAPIPEFEGLYDISRQGVVRSLERIDASGRHRQTRILKPYYTSKNIRVVKLTDNYCNEWQFGVARLVWTVFVGEPSSDEYVTFKDNDPQNCALDNLIVVSRKDISLRGEKHPKARLTQADVDYIRSPECDLSVKELAFVLGVTPLHIRAILKGKAWKP